MPYDKSSSHHGAGMHYSTDSPPRKPGKSQRVGYTDVVPQAPFAPVVQAPTTPVEDEKMGRQAKVNSTYYKPNSGHEY